MVRQNRDEQVRPNAVPLAVVDRAQAHFALQTAEGRLNVAELPIRAHHALQVPVTVTGAQQIGPRCSRALGVFGVALPHDGGGQRRLGFARPTAPGPLRCGCVCCVGFGNFLGDRDVILARHGFVALLDASEALQHARITLGATRFGQRGMQLAQFLLEAFPALCEHADLFRLAALAPDAQTRFGAVAVQRGTSKMTTLFPSASSCRNRYSMSGSSNRDSQGTKSSLPFLARCGSNVVPTTSWFPFRTPRTK